MTPLLYPKQLARNYTILNVQNLGKMGRGDSHIDSRLARTRNP